MLQVHEWTMTLNYKYIKKAWRGKKNRNNLLLSLVVYKSSIQTNFKARKIIFVIIWHSKIVEILF